MKPPPFEYHRVGSAEEAVALLAEYGDEAKILAGGQSLVPLLSLRLAHPAHLIDINRAGDLGEVTDGADLRIGAVVRHRTVERSPLVAAANPLLAAATALIGHRAIRSRGTVGGSLAHCDPAAELPAVIAAVEGSVEVRSARGGRSIPSCDLFEGFLTTSIEPDELLVEVRVPALGPRTGWSFQEFSRRNGDFAIVGVAATIRLSDGGEIAEARLAFSGAGSRPLRATAAESGLEGAVPSAELWADASREAAGELDPPGDLHGSAEYRRHLGAVLAERALNEAYTRAREVAA